MAEQGADILSQIKGLLDQYLALGPDTPVYDSAQQLSQDIEAELSGGPEPTTTGELPMGPESVVTPPAPGSGFAGARKAGTAYLDNVNKKKKKAKAL